MCSGFGLVPYDESLYVDPKLSISISQIDNKYATFDFIRDIFHKLNIGEVTNIYFNEKIGEYGKSAIIYINWYNNILVKNLQNKIINPEADARLVYNDPFYWVLHEYKPYEQSSLLQTINSLEKKTSELENRIQNIETNTFNSKLHIQNMYKNNSCCGAASEAWIPSYPSLWSKRLRPRNS